MEQFDTDTIDKYLLGRLTEAERTTFESALATTPALVQAVEQQRTMLRGIELHGEQQFAAQVKQADEALANTGFFLQETDIDAYLQATADAHTTQLVEQRMQTDEAFAQRVAAQQDLMTGIETFGEQDFLATLKNTDTELAAAGFFTPKTTKKTPTAKVVPLNRWRRFASIAAAVAGLVIAVWGAWLFLQPTDNFADNFEVYEDQLSPYLEETGFVRPDYFDDLQVAMQLYQEEKYTTAVSKFMNYLQTAPQDDPFYELAQFYQAQSYLASQQMEAAIPILEQLSTQNDFPLREDASWYLALSYLANDKAAAAQPLLQQLLNSKKYGARAKGLL